MVLLKRRFNFGLVSYSGGKSSFLLSQISKRLLAIPVLLAGPLLLIILSPSVHAESVSLNYQSSQPLPLGTLVSLTQVGGTQLTKATTNNQDLLVGAVTNAQSAVIDVEPAGSNVQVATSGRHKVLVSTAGGDIHAGDDLIISPVGGLAMKPRSQDAGSRLIGAARQDFTANSSSTQLTIETKDGASRQVTVGLIDVDINLDRGSSTASSADQNLLTHAVERLTGRQVSTGRTIASGTVALLTIALTGMLLQGAVRGTFVSLGRNPLARASVMPILIRVIIMAIVFLGCGFTIAYATLIV